MTGREILTLAGKTPVERFRLDLKLRGGQAKKSQHIEGKAADIHFPDVPVKALRASALIQEVGGVGYYPTSGIPFVHVDTGHVRMWPRMPRLELAALFPDGKTVASGALDRTIRLWEATTGKERFRWRSDSNSPQTSSECNPAY